MKISTLIIREPFESIFEDTLASFLLDWTGCKYTVKWEASHDLKASFNVEQVWYCNPLINSIFVRGVNPAVFESINGEYAHNPMAPWRSWFQNLYLILSQSKILATKLSKYKITISPPIGCADNKLIIGGNTKLRLMDLAKKEVYVLLKEGFDEKYLQKEIFVRLEFPYLPIPKIIELGRNGRWYSEEYILGKPPNRLDQVFGDKILLKAVSHVHQMLHETKKGVILSEYVTRMEADINEGIDNILYIDIDVANDIKSITSSLSYFLEKSENQELTLAHCHGDFHQGNILANNDEYWILDWEYSGVKQIAYDLLILLLESRIDNGFAARFLNIVNNDLNEFQIKLANDWPELNWNDEDSKARYLMVFLLEDLLFHIKESGNKLFYEKSDILKNRCNEIKKIVTVLL
jgi:thiamine kinase-like enzyme